LARSLGCPQVSEVRRTCEWPASLEPTAADGADGGGPGERAAAGPGGLRDPGVGHVEVGLPVLAGPRQLPAAGDHRAVGAEGPGEALRERRALSLQRPLAGAKTHLVDATDPAVVGVELDVGSVRRVAADD